MTLPQLYNGADGSLPGNPLPKGTQILAAYVGAKDLPVQPDTPHIWSLDEWNMYLDPDSPLYGGPDLRVLPIFVHDFPADPAELAANAVDAVTDLGWKPGRGRLIVLDTETLVDLRYVHLVDQEIVARGFRMMDYGSERFVIQNRKPSGGYWAALLTANRPTVLPAQCDGQQYRFGPEWDLDVFSGVVYANCGRGMRHSAA